MCALKIKIRIYIRIRMCFVTRRSSLLIQVYLTRVVMAGTKEPFALRLIPQATLSRNIFLHQYDRLVAREICPRESGIFSPVGDLAIPLPSRHFRINVGQGKRKHARVSCAPAYRRVESWNEGRRFSGGKSAAEWTPRPVGPPPAGRSADFSHVCASLLHLCFNFSPKIHFGGKTTPFPTRRDDSHSRSVRVRLSNAIRLSSRAVTPV